MVPDPLEAARVSASVPSSQKLARRREKLYVLCEEPTQNQRVLGLKILFENENGQTEVSGFGSKLEILLHLHSHIGK